MSNTTIYSSNQQECIELLSLVFGGTHNLNPLTPIRKVGIEMKFYGSLSTFDSSKLTHLVLLAHQKAIRVEIDGCGHHRLKISLFYRGERQGEIYSRHPTLETAISKLSGVPVS